MESNDLHSKLEVLTSSSVALSSFESLLTKFLDCLETEEKDRLLLGKVRNLTKARNQRDGRHDERIQRVTEWTRRSI